LFFQTPAIVFPHVLVSGGYQKGRGLCSEAAPRLAGLYPTLKLKNCPGPAFWEPVLLGGQGVFEE